jgi:hypothetical protein
MLREVSDRGGSAGRWAPRPRGRRRLAMASHAQCLEILEVMQATERAMRAQRRLEMVDLKPVRRPPGTPRPHGAPIVPVDRETRARGPFRRHVPAAAAAILITALGCATRLRPPVVIPKRLAADVAAPRPAPRRQCLTAPGATAGPCSRERASCQQRGALRRFGYRNAASRSASNCGDASPARKSGSAAIENCIPVQNWPNSPNRDDASSKRIS